MELNGILALFNLGTGEIIAILVVLFLAIQWFLSFFRQNRK